MIALTDAEYDGLKARIAALEAELAAAQEELRVCQQEAITAHKRVAELEQWQRKRTTITGQVIDETVKLDARIAALEAALRAYGKHQYGCGRVSAPMPPPDNWMTNLELEAWQSAQPCTCGFDAALAG